MPTTCGCRKSSGVRLRFFGRRMQMWFTATATFFLIMVSRNEPIFLPWFRDTKTERTCWTCYISTIGSPPYPQWSGAGQLNRWDCSMKAGSSRIVKTTTYGESKMLKPMIEVVKKHSDAVDRKTSQQRIRELYRELVTTLIAENDLT